MSAPSSPKSINSRPFRLPSAPESDQKAGVPTRMSPDDAPTKRSSGAPKTMNEESSKSTTTTHSVKESIPKDITEILCVGGAAALPLSTKRSLDEVSMEFGEHSKSMSNLIGKKMRMTLAVHIKDPQNEENEVCVVLSDSYESAAEMVQQPFLDLAQKNGTLWCADTSSLDDIPRWVNSPPAIPSIASAEEEREHDIGIEDTENEEEQEGVSLS